MNASRKTASPRKNSASGQAASPKIVLPPPSDEDLRKSGIRLVGNLAWGSHICIFYETPQDLLDTAVSYFRAGLENNEYCLWAVSAPVTTEEAVAALRSSVPGFAEYSDKGQIEILDGHSWYLPGGRLDVKKITSGWDAKQDAALMRGYAGARVSGNAFWIESKQWSEFREYEAELDRAIAGKKTLVLCTYALTASMAVDVMDVTRTHNYSFALRNGEWTFLRSPELEQAQQEIGRLNGALEILSRPFHGAEHLTPNERIALAHIVRGASAKEAARSLGVSPRTVEFHRANVMKKMGAKNAADLVRKVYEQN